MAGGSGHGLRVDEFDYHLPDELIAREPSPERDGARLLVLERATGAIRHSSIRDLGCWLNAGDLLVANNSRVIAARLSAMNPLTGGRVELLLLGRDGQGGWTALAKPARRLRAGMRLVVPALLPSELPDAELTVVAKCEGGEVRVVLDREPPSWPGAYGSLPLPPYVAESIADEARYQTVYAASEGSVAAPTAGLHLTRRSIAALGARGVGWAEVTLHVGADTFRPVNVERVEDHRIHREWCSVGDETASAVAAAKRSGGRVVAVGTTTARTIETMGRAWNIDHPLGWTGMTDLFIVPGYRWQVVDSLITNFHVPRSTLLMMVCAFAGQDAIMRAYREAIAARYRFFSFGDAMLIR